MVIYDGFSERNILMNFLPTYLNPKQNRLIQECMLMARFSIFQQ